MCAVYHDLPESNIDLAARRFLFVPGRDLFSPNISATFLVPSFATCNVIACES